MSATASPPAASAAAPRYRRHQPETTALYEVVRDNLETLYGAIEDGAIAVRIPKHARKELEAYLDCGLLCRGFARLRCEDCSESLLVAFSCKGRGFCPSCMGRRMCATAANLIERVLPETGLRQWVLTFLFSWRRRLAQDGALLGRLTRIFVETVHAFYAERAEKEGAIGAKTGSVTAVQRTSSDMRLSPHLHMVALDGAYHEQGTELAWQALGHLKTSQVGEVLFRAVRRIDKHLRRRGLVRIDDDVTDEGAEGDPESNLARSAVSGQAPAAVAARPSAARAARARVRQAALRHAGRVHVARRHPCWRARPGGPRGAFALRAAAAGRAGASASPPRRPGAHHLEEGVCRRNGRRRHGPAVAAVPAGDQRAPTAVPYREVRGCPRAGEQVESAHRAEAAP